MNFLNTLLNETDTEICLRMEVIQTIGDLISAVKNEKELYIKDAPSILTGLTGMMKGMESDNLHIPAILKVCA